MSLPTLSSQLLSHSSLNHGFFTRHGGHSTGPFQSLNCSLARDDRETVLLNRALVQTHLQADYLYIPQPVHGTDVLAVTSANLDNIPNVDALVTNVPGIAVGALGADCAPILLTDTEAGVIAAAHAGWKGAFHGIVQATVNEMEKLGANRTSIKACVGPCIAVQSYEVGKEFEERFLENDMENARFFVQGKDKPRFDLRKYVQMELEKCGVGEVEVLEVDTKTDERFFSARQEKGGVFGCQVSAIVLKRG